MSEKGTLSGKRMLVTGAAAGIGRAVALAAAGAGARVALLDRNQAGLEETYERIGAAGLLLHCDVTGEQAVAEAYGKAASAWGGLDAVAAVAGIELAGAGDDRIDSVDLDIWRRIVDVNLTGIFLTCKYAARALLAAGGGTITLTGSPCAITGKCSGETAYSASKAGVHGLVRLMANDLAHDGIRVNAVIPGFVATQLNAPVLADPKMLQTVVQSIPMRRAGQPEEIAPLFVWLASDAAAYVTGAFMTADGGMTAV